MAVAVESRVEPANSGLWREVTYFWLLMALCPLVAMLAPGDAQLAQSNAEALLGVERMLGINNEAAFSSRLAQWPLMSGIADAFYLASHLSAVIGVLLWLYFRRPQMFPYVRNMFALVQVGNVLGYLLLPMAPPHLLGVDVALPANGWAKALQYEYAAFPSGHVNFALVVGIGLWCGSSRLPMRLLAIAYPLVVTMTVVATGNHYWLDAAAAWAIVVVVSGLLWRWAPRGPVETRSGWPERVRNVGGALDLSKAADQGR